jgi:hypothetical protein
MTPADRRPTRGPSSGASPRRWAPPPTPGPRPRADAAGTRPAATRPPVTAPSSRQLARWAPPHPAPPWRPARVEADAEADSEEEGS